MPCGVKRDFHKVKILKNLRGAGKLRAFQGIDVFNWTKAIWVENTPSREPAKCDWSCRAASLEVLRLCEERLILCEWRRWKGHAFRSSWRKCGVAPGTKKLKAGAAWSHFFVVGISRGDEGKAFCRGGRKAERAPCASWDGSGVAEHRGSQLLHRSSLAPALRRHNTLTAHTPGFFFYFMAFIFFFLIFFFGHPIHVN